MNTPKPVLLLVEDDSWTRYALGRILSKHGWTIIAAPDLASGIDLLKENPCCVILDLNLPDGKGEVLLREIRDERSDCRVVICTAITDEARLDHLKFFGPNRIVEKPIEVMELLAACQP